MVIERIGSVGGVVEIGARARGSTAMCPACGERSARVHSRYERSLDDVAVGGQPVRIRLRVRRFICTRGSCTRKTFVEQVEDLTVRYGRRSLLLAAMLQTIALMLAGRAGARLAGRLAVPVSRSTLLRLVRAMPEPPASEVSEVGIDDFAFRRGHVYGTIVIDMQTHRPLEVLPDRTADTVAAWLEQHPGIAVICRDRAGAYAEAARTGAPNAVQVADRWHLWHNLCEAVDKAVAAHRCDLRPETYDEPKTQEDNEMRDEQPAVEHAASPTDAATIDGRLVTRTRERYTAVQALRGRGRTITAISQELGLDRRTARRFARAAQVDDLLDKARSRSSVLAEFKPYLNERFNSGHTDAAALTVEIQGMGYRGSDKTVRRYLQSFRATLTAPPATPVVPSVRQVTGWLTRHPDSLEVDERVQRKAILTRSPALTTTARHVGEFAQMLTGRHGDRLADWIADVVSTDAAPLRSFANGLGRDLDAVTAGLTLDYNSGAVEGTVNRIKTIKRQMYGRASFDLLRKRILHPI